MEAEEALFGFGLFDDFPEGELHPLQIDVFEDENENSNQRTKINIYRPVKEGTELHRAIRSGRQVRIDALLDTYQLDFMKIKDYLVLKYQWDPEDHIWLRKVNLVAVNEDQCRSVKDLERNREADGRVSLERSIFVLLQTPVGGEEVAVLHPEYYDNLELFKALWKLFPNGYLSWDYFMEDHGRWETFIEAAAGCEKMIQYRGKYYGESKSQAFNSIFHFEDDDCPYLSTLTYLRPGKVQKKIEEYIVEFELDLSYRRENASIALAQLLRKKLALEYCRAQIRQNPELLGMMRHDGNGPTILHECISCDELELLNDMYMIHPEVKQNFNHEYGFILFREALDNHRNDRVQFMLKYHKDFLWSNMERLQLVIFNRNNIEAFYEWNETILSEHLPELKGQIEDAIVTAHELQIVNDLEKEFKEITEKIKGNLQNVSQYQHILSSIRGPSGESALHFAVENDNLLLFEKLIQVGCDLNVSDNEGNHPIHYVRSVDMLNLIIESHPQGRSLVNRVNSAGWSVLQKVCSHYATSTNTLIQLVGTLIEYGADVNHLTKSGETAAFMTWSVPVLEMLMNHGINLNVVNDSGETAVLRHLWYQNTWVARILLPLAWDHPSFEENAHKYLAPLLKTKRYAFDYYRSLLDDNPDKTKKMLDAVYQRSPEEASRLFASACDRTRLFYVQKFLEYNYELDFNYRDQYGYTPIMGLLNFNKESPGHLIRQLLEKNVDLKIRNQWDQTPLLIIASRFASARRYDQGISTVELLLQHGAQINEVDESGNTALHLAFKSSEWELVELLIRNGADLTATNNDGKRPWESGPCAIRDIFRLIWSSNNANVGS